MAERLSERAFRCERDKKNRKGLYLFYNIEVYIVYNVVAELWVGDGVYLMLR